MAENNMLEILTKSDRQPFIIDGKQYEMRHPNELSMTEFYELSKTGSVLVALGEEFSTDPEGSFKKIHKVINKLLDMITPDLPKAVRDELNPFHVMRILEHFIGLSRIEPKPDGQPIPKKSSPGSAASTADSHKTG